MRVPCLITLALAAGLVSCGSADKTESPHTYQLGERVTLGHISYTVFERQWHNDFGTAPDLRVPRDRFCTLRITALNNGGSELIIPSAELVDDGGNTYAELTDGEGVQDWLGNLRQVRPTETAQGFLLFDVPAKHFKLKLTDEEGKRSALVDIPLSFETDTPDVTTPLDPDKIPVSPTKK
jgi:hypothetical protein